MYQSVTDNCLKIMFFYTPRPNFKFHFDLIVKQSLFIKTARHNFMFHSGLYRDRDPFLCFKDSETQFYVSFWSYSHTRYLYMH